MTNKNEQVKTISDADIMQHVVTSDILGGVRTISINGENWFAATDVCRIFNRLFTTESRCTFDITESEEVEVEVNDQEQGKKRYTRERICGK